MNNSKFSIFSLVLIISLHGYSRDVLAENNGILPLLAPGQHYGLQNGFNPQTPQAIKTKLNALLQEARQDGMDIIPVEADWPELEPTKNVYDKDVLLTKLSAAQSLGLKPLVYLNIIDADDIILPNYLEGGDNNIVSVADINIDTPEIMTRYKKLLDWVVPMVTQFGGVAMIVGNEPDNHLEANPDKTDSVVNALIQARDYIHTLNPNMSVAMTLSSGFDQLRDDQTRIVQASDFGSFNFYCENPPQVVTAQQIESRLNLRINAAAGKHIIFQELGCVSAGSTEERQRQWFASFFTLMKNNPSIRLAVVFQLVDWSPEALQSYQSFLRPAFLKETNNDEVQTQAILDYLSDSLGTIGLVRYSDGSAKPAWNEFMKALK